MGTELSTTKSSTVTEKKVKIEGFQRFVNVDTGEIVDFQTSRIEQRDFNFEKVWIDSFLASLDLIGGKKFSVARWIIENRNKENQVIGTIRSIAEQTETSTKTVQEVINALMGCGFMRRIQSGVYMIDPNTIFKGSRNARMGVAQIYQSIPENETDEPTGPSIEEQITQVTAAIADLQSRLSELQKNAAAETVEIDGQYTIIDTDMTVGQRAKRGGGKRGKSK